MALETGTYISDLVVTNPTATDLKSQGDDHLRLVKSTIKNTFPNVTGVVTPSHTELGYVTGVTSAIQAQLNAPASVASINSGPLGGLRNGLINGNFDVWQDKTSFATIVQNQYLADRWAFTSAVPSTSTCQRGPSIDTPSSYSFQWNSVTNTARFEIAQAMTAINASKYIGKSITVSVKLQGNAGNVRTCSVALDKNATGDTLLGGTWTQRGTNSVTLSTSTQTAFFNVFVPNDGSALGLRVRVSDGGAGLAGDIIYVGKVRHEIGSVVSQMDQEPYSLTLLLCQRHYQNLTFNLAGYNAAGAAPVVSIPLLAQMHAAPTAGTIAAGTGTNITGSFFTSTPTTDSGQAILVGVTVTALGSYSLTNARIGLRAEL